jgi:hypothetical protein
MTWVDKSIPFGISHQCYSINYNDVDLDTVNAPVSYMIETGGSGAYVRGGSSLTYSGTWLTNSTATNRGWRPVLRDITPI